MPGQIVRRQVERRPGRRRRRAPERDHHRGLRRHPVPQRPRVLHVRLRARGRPRRHPGPPRRARRPQQPLRRRSRRPTRQHRRTAPSDTPTTATAPGEHDHDGRRRRRPRPRPPPPAEPCVPSCSSAGSAPACARSPSRTPKQMLPVVDRPMIEWVRRRPRRAHGVDEAVLSLGYRPDAFQAAYPDGTCAGVRLRYAVEPEPLDTAGAIRFAALDAGIDERFVVVNGDVLTDLDLTALVAFHDRTRRRGRRSPCTRSRTRRRSASSRPTPTAGCRPSSRSRRRDEAPTDLINAGTYVLEPSVLDRIPGGRRVSIERETFPAMVADGTPVRRRRRRRSTGSTPARRRSTSTAMLDLVDGRRAGRHRRPVARRRRRSAASAVLDDAVVMAGAIRRPAPPCGAAPCCPAPSSRPAPCVDDSIVGPGAVVGAGARVRRRLGARATASVVARRPSSTARRVPEPVDGMSTLAGHRRRRLHRRPRRPPPRSSPAATSSSSTTSPPASAAVRARRRPRFLEGSSHDLAAAEPRRRRRRRAPGRAQVRRRVGRTSRCASTPTTSRACVVLLEAMVGAGVEQFVYSSSLLGLRHAARRARRRVHADRRPRAPTARRS